MLCRDVMGVLCRTPASGSILPSSTLCWKCCRPPRLCGEIMHACSGWEYTGECCHLRSSCTADEYHGLHHTVIVPAIAATDRDYACMSRLDAYRGLEQHRMPHYPGAYLESKHCKIFAHWKSPKGVSFGAALFLIRTSAHQVNLGVVLYPCSLRDRLRRTACVLAEAVAGGSEYIDLPTVKSDYVDLVIKILGGITLHCS